MPLIVSISGIRGVFGDGLDPDTLVKYSSAFGTWCRQNSDVFRPTIVIGRDARVTGELCSRLVSATLQSCGCDVIDAGLAPTPTVEMAVIREGAQGGVIFSASHNPAEWNALKLLNQKGEFLSPDEASDMIGIAEQGRSEYVRYDQIGSYARQDDHLRYHIQKILELPYIDAARIGARNFKVVVDGINSVGGVAIPTLLEALGVRKEKIICLNCEPSGIFAHNPEPLPAHVGDTMDAVSKSGADLGIIVDPDADRLALVEDGGLFLGEELTQVVAADFLMRRKPGPFVTNLSSSRAIEDVAARYEQPVYRSAVGEINVVKKMQEVGATLGGEGNGGVILPDLHYGRDALVGVALILQHLAEENTSLSEIRRQMPVYHISKNKVELGSLDADALLEQMSNTYRHEQLSTVDGLKIDFDEGWVHLRKSNTEPIIRIYAEGKTVEDAELLAQRFMAEIERATNFKS